MPDTLTQPTTPRPYSPEKPRVRWAGQFQPFYELPFFNSILLFVDTSRISKDLLDTALLTQITLLRESRALPLRSHQQ